MKAMNPVTFKQHQTAVRNAENARDLLAAVRVLAGDSEDLDVAQARIENWLSENKGRWVA